MFPCYREGQCKTSGKQVLCNPGTAFQAQSRTAVGLESP